MEQDRKGPSEAGWGRRLIAALVTAAVLVAGIFALQRWVAETFQVALALAVGWFAIVTVAAFLFGRSDRGMHVATLGSIALVGLASAGFGYWTTLRKDEVDERVLVATDRASGRQLMSSLSGTATDDADAKPPTQRMNRNAPTGPVELASGPIAGADGHAGEGKATIVEDPNGDRTLTLTEFDVDAGPDVDVYLSETTSGIEGAVNLGDLKGERGDQQYDIPTGVDLTKFDDVVLWCIPFTTRIATAEPA